MVIGSENRVRDVRQGAIHSMPRVSVFLISRSRNWLSRAISGDEFAYGYLKLTYHLRREYGLVINKKKVYRLCKEMRILRPQRKLKPRRPRKIARNRTVTGPNQLLETNIKYRYVHGESRFFFIQSVVDVYNRMIVNYHIGLSCTAQDVALTLQNVKRHRLPEGMHGVVIRTDNGPQFISERFAQMCQMEPERIPCKTPNKNAHIESFYSILEHECRIHSSLGFCMPREIHEAFFSNTTRLEPISA